MTDDTRALADTYFRSWQDGDFATLRSILADDVTFHGTLGTAEGADGCLAGLQRLAQIITAIDIRRMVVDGTDVMTWYDMHTSMAPPCPTVNWSHAEGGRIATIRAVFDPRGLLQGMA